MSNSNATKFGPASNSDSFYAEGFKHTVQTPEWLSKRGLNAYEYSFGRGVKMKTETAQAIGAKFKEFDIALSVHAPYYINFASEEQERIDASVGFVLQAAQKLLELGGQRVIFHTAGVGGEGREKSLQRTKDSLKFLAGCVHRVGLTDTMFCPETMGKLNQIGDHKEIAQLCKIDKIYTPCIDFGHLNSRTFGGLKTEADYDEIVSYLLAELGYERINNMHIHFSKIEYGKSGEIRHLTFKDDKYGPDFAPLATVLRKYKLNPTIICESEGTQAEDALEMKKIFFGK